MHISFNFPLKLILFSFNRLKKGKVLLGCVKEEGEVVKSDTGTKASGKTNYKA